MNKLSHGQSVSSSSAASFHADNICTSKSATAAGCLAGILRRILCSRSLPTHPSDHITYASSIGCDKLHEFESKEKLIEGQVMPMPSIVARLMGLESMPNSITRSRSMNSLDCKGSSDRRNLRDEHRRVKSTSSFREMPTFVELENEEFFVLSFENGSETKEKRFKGRKCEMGNGELKQRRGEKCRNNESRAKVTEKNNSNEKKFSRRISDKPAPEVGISVEVKNSTKTCEQQYVLGLVSESNGAKLRRRKKKKVKNVEHECSSEESSPISVLDFDQFLLDLEFPISELDSDEVDSNSRRKLSPEPENYEWQSRRRNDNNLITPDDRKTKKTDGKCVGSGNRNADNQSYLEMCEQICKMTEADLVEESSWIHTSNILKHKDFEDICADFGLQILDQTLDELVHQLIELPF